MSPEHYKDGKPQPRAIGQTCGSLAARPLGLILSPYNQSAAQLSQY